MPKGRKPIRERAITAVERPRKGRAKIKAKLPPPGSEKRFRLELLWWLQDQAWLKQMRLQLELACKMASQKNGDQLDAAGLRLAVARMYSFLTTFDPAQLNTQLASQPAAYARILNSLCKLAETSIKCDRHRCDPSFKTSKPVPEIAPAKSSSRSSRHR